MSVALSTPALLRGINRGDVPYLRALQAEERLTDFITMMWSAVEPTTPYIGGWVIEAIAEHLEAVTAGEITRLIINVSPGMMKSLATCVFWPAWEWGPRNRPSTRYLCASYSSQLTERDNLRTSQLIQSPLYRAHWGDRFTATESMVKILTDKTGWKLATSVGGVGTGERGQRVILDDPNSVKQAESQTIRASTNQWLREVMPTRLSDPRTSAIILIQQRTHEEDATGTLLTDEGDYEHLMIPMEYDGRRYVTGIGWQDPRTVEDIDPEVVDREWWRVKGELCFPERFPAWVVERDKRAMGSYAAEGQFQQAPSPRGGGIIRLDWWQQWGPSDPRGIKFPPFDVVIASYDGAHTTKTHNDPCALAVLGTFRDLYPNPREDEDREIALRDGGPPPARQQLTGMPRVMLARAWSERLAINDAVRKIDETCRRLKVSILLVENKANGHDVVNELHRIFREKPYSVVLTDPRGSVAGRGGYDKVARAMSVVPLFEDEMVYAPNTDWAVSVKQECAIFPRGKHDDQVDAVVSGIRWLRDNGALDREAEVLVAERDAAMDEDARGRSVPLYRT